MLTHIDKSQHMFKPIQYYNETFFLILKVTRYEFCFLTGCCPNKNPFERALKRFLLINLGEAEDKRFQLFEPKGRVLKSPGASLKFIKKRFRQSEKGFEQQPVNI
jgi:hypothetical protein